MDEEEAGNIRARADAIQLAIEHRRQPKSDLPTPEEIEVTRHLEPGAARVAVDILLDEGLGLTELLDWLEEAGKLRAAVQLLQKAGLNDAATEANHRFYKAWQDLNETDPRFFADEHAAELLGKLEAVVRLLRQAAIEDDKAAN